MLGVGSRMRMCSHSSITGKTADWVADNIVYTSSMDPVVTTVAGETVEIEDSTYSEAIKDFYTDSGAFMSYSESNLLENADENGIINLAKMLPSQKGRLLYLYGKELVDFHSEEAAKEQYSVAKAKPEGRNEDGTHWYSIR